MKKKLFGLIGILFLIPSAASAATFHAGSEYTLSQNETITDNLYVAAGNVEFLGKVEGDLVVAGGEVNIVGDILEDLIVAGGDVQVVGTVEEDARIAGGEVMIRSDIAQDLLVAGGRVNITTEAQIEGDIAVAGGDVIFRGNAGGNLRVSGGRVMIDGVVDGDVEIKAGEVVIGQNANIRGSLRYSADREATIPEEASIAGPVTFDPRADEGFTREAIVSFLTGLVMVLVLALLAVLLFPRFSKNLATYAVAHIGRDILVGLAMTILIPIFAVLLFITVIGIPLGLIVLFGFIILLIVAWIYAGVIAGAVLARLIRKEVIIDWKWTILGVVALQLIGLIPIIGGIVWFVFMLAALGALGDMMYVRGWRERRGGERNNR